VKAVVIGAAGYAGGELLRLLLQHPEIREVAATSRSQAGKRLGEVHPAVAPLTDARFSDAAPAEAARRADVVFLALEHGESSRHAAAVLAAEPRLVIDLAADFRIQDPALHERFYGPHSAPELVGRFVYGLADVEGERLRGARAIAVPGCFATAAQLALYPLARAQLDVAPALFAVTGSSGAGSQPKPTTHHPMRAHNLFAYSVLGHRHEGEVLAAWRRWTGRPDAEARLIAHSGPFVRGIYLTCHARTAVDSSAIAACVRSAYEGRPFVRVLDAPPELTHVVGTNYAYLYAAASADGREVVLLVAIDNLVKGAAGQAVQAMNLALGLPEEAGLRGGGIYPC
jgi:N-acetyl-gamma-glutamyl-phosphate reductase